MTWWNDLDPRRHPMQTITALAEHGLSVHFTRRARECRITKGQAHTLYWGTARTPRGTEKQCAAAALVDAVLGMQHDLHHRPARAEVLA
jgi:hypothetical protein